MPNRLIHETSPYLLQHADNPVDWMPWNTETLALAVREQKPIFLSIGYAACHWCHVMAHESFEDPQIAAILNEHFIPIKVDREERPDIDSVYMNAVVTMTGQGGWPMSLFLTPEGDPFYGGTYFPPEPRYGMPAFSQVLLAAAQAWENNRDELRKTGQELVEHLALYSIWSKDDDLALRPNLLDQATQSLLGGYDWQQGGWGQAPRFPQAMALEFLLLQAARGNQQAGKAAIHNLNIMARGGMYDVVGGGFARYSTDDQWLVPHFEKMLYDNAQLALAYLHAGLANDQPPMVQTATHTLDFILHELTHPEGGFFSSLDADSEGREGKFYLWSYAELQAALEPLGDFDWFRQVYGLTEGGNFEGQIVLRRVADQPDLVQALGISESELTSRLDRAHEVLLSARSRRVHPATDDKVLVAWNGLALRAFAEAARYLGRADYLSAAQRNARFLLDHLWDGQELKRSWREGKAHQPGFLEDYAALIIGLLALYQADFDPRWYAAAQQLAQTLVASFADPVGGFFDTPAHLNDLFVRPKDYQDNATPCGNSLAAYALLLLDEFAPNPEFRRAAEAALPALQDLIVRHPTAFGMWLQAADLAYGPVKQVALVLAETPDSTSGLVAQVNKRWRARMVVTASRLPLPPEAPELFHDRPLVNGQSTAYVCERFTCRLPVTSPDDLARQLG